MTRGCADDHMHMRYECHEWSCGHVYVSCCDLQVLWLQVERLAEYRPCCSLNWFMCMFRTMTWKSSAWRSRPCCWSWPLNWCMNHLLRVSFKIMNHYWWYDPNAKTRGGSSCWHFETESVHGAWNGKKSQDFMSTARFRSVHKKQTLTHTTLVTVCTFFYC